MNKKLKFVFLITLFMLNACDVNDSTNNMGSVYIESLPAGARIYLDGNNTDKETPATISAEAGMHTITLKLEGYSDFVIDIEIVANETLRLTENNTLAKLGYLIIESIPTNALIWLDGINTEKYTPNTFETDPGNHTITLQLENYQNTTIITRVESTDTTREIIKMISR